MKKTVEKYNGFVNCACENGEFVFCAEIFRDPEGANAGAAGASVLARVQRRCPRSLRL